MTQLQVNLPDITLPESNLSCTCESSHGILGIGVKTCQKLCDIADTQDGDDKNILLRAALVFGCSTFDSVGKQMTKDSLEQVINNDDGAQRTFEDFISREIKKEPEKILSRVLSKPDYRSELIMKVQESVEGKSLQSYEEISKLSAKFGISVKDIISESDAKNLFGTRQQVIHELDMDPHEQGRQRTRLSDELVKQTEAILSAAAKLIAVTHEKIHMRPATAEESKDNALAEGEES